MRIFDFFKLKNLLNKIQKNKSKIVNPKSPGIKWRHNINFRRSKNDEGGY